MKDPATGTRTAVTATATAAMIRFTVTPSTRWSNVTNCPLVEGATGLADSQAPHLRELVHLCPPGDSGSTPCCGRTPFELPPYDRMTSDEKLVTCNRQ